MSRPQAVVDLVEQRDSLEETPWNDVTLRLPAVREIAAYIEHIEELQLKVGYQLVAADDRIEHLERAERALTAENKELFKQRAALEQELSQRPEVVKAEEVTTEHEVAFGREVEARRLSSGLSRPGSLWRRQWP